MSFLASPPLKYPFLFIAIVEYSFDISLGYHIKASCPSSRHLAGNQACWRGFEIIPSSTDNSRLQEVHSCLKGHFLQRWSIRLYANPIEGLIFSLERHVVCHEWEVAIINRNVVIRKYTPDFLQKKTGMLWLP